MNGHGHRRADPATRGSSTSGSTGRRREAALDEAPFEHVRSMSRLAPPSKEAGIGPNAGGFIRAPAALACARLWPGLPATWYADPDQGPALRLADPESSPDHQLVVFARDDDYFLGVLHSMAHELWALGQQRSWEIAPGFRYTPRRPSRPSRSRDPPPKARERGQAAGRLVDRRDGWLNPPGFDPADLAKRTLTNLDNAAPHLARPGARRSRRRRPRRLRLVCRPCPTPRSSSASSRLTSRRRASPSLLLAKEMSAIPASERVTGVDEEGPR